MNAYGHGPWHEHGVDEEHYEKPTTPNESFNHPHVIVTRCTLDSKTQTLTLRATDLIVHRYRVADHGVIISEREGWGGGLMVVGVTDLRG